VALSSDGSFTYTPAANWHGADSFYYVANKGFIGVRPPLFKRGLTPNKAMK